MSISLIILGMTLVFASGLYCVLDPQRKEQKWVLGAILIPVIAIPYYRKRWDELFILGYAQVLGMVLIVVGLVFLIQENSKLVNNKVVISFEPDSPKIFSNEYTEYSLGEEEGERNAALKRYVSGKANKDLSGTLRGEPFLYSRAELINGTLRIKSDSSFYSKMEVVIHWGIDEKTIEDKVSKFVVPRSDNPPEIFISWLSPGNNIPETQIIRKGYQMELAVTKILGNELKGELKLTLPDEFKSKIMGRFVAYTNNLHYTDGKIDLDFDHNDTLEFVASEYLNTQFAEDAVSRIDYSLTNYKPISKVGSTTAKIFLVNGGVVQQTVGLQKNVTGWIVDAENLGERIYLVKASNADINLFADDVLKDPRLERLRKEQEEKNKLVTPDPITLAFSGLESYSNREAVATDINGKKLEGLFKGLRRNRVVIEAIVGAGKVEYFMLEKEIKTLYVKKSRQLINVTTPTIE